VKFVVNRTKRTLEQEMRGRHIANEKRYKKAQDEFVKAQNKRDKAWVKLDSDMDKIDSWYEKESSKLINKMFSNKRRK